VRYEKDGMMDARTARVTLHHWIDQADDTQVVGFVELLRTVIEQQRGVSRAASAIEKDNLDGFGPRIPIPESYAEQDEAVT
jgi:hypothetical protein